MRGLLSFVTSALILPVFYVGKDKKLQKLKTQQLGTNRTTEHANDEDMHNGLKTAHMLVTTQSNYPSPPLFIHHLPSLSLRLFFLCRLSQKN